MADIEIVYIEDDDRFMFYWDGLIQKRGERWRSITPEAVNEWRTTDCGTTSCPCSTDLARATIRGWGHKTMHTVHMAAPPAPPTQPQPSYPVVRVAELTHGVTCCGALTAIGTLEHCLKYTDDHVCIVRLDWTGVGDRPPTAIKDNGPMPDPKPTTDFKVGDVVRGRVVGARWAIQNRDGTYEQCTLKDAGVDTFTSKDSAHSACEYKGGTVKTFALVEVEAQ